MPRIKLPSYDPQTKAPGAVQIPAARDFTAGNFGAGAAAGLGDLAQGGEKVFDMVGKRAEQSELSDLNAKMAQTHADFTNKWQETLRTADPGDKTIAAKFLENYDTQVQKIRDGVETRAGELYFNKANAEMRGHFDTTAVASQAQLAGVKAVTDYSSTVNNLSSSVLNDPSAFPLALTQHQDALDNMVKTGLLSKEKALELSSKSMPEIAKNAVRGQIRLDPDWAEETLNKGGMNQYFNGDVKKQLYGEIEQKRTADRTAADRAQQEQDRALQLQINARQTELLKNIFIDGKLDVQKVLDDKLLPSFGSGSKQQIINMLEEYNKQGGKIKMDPSVVTALFERAHSAENAPGHISDENDINPYFAHGLDERWLNFIRAEVSGRKTAEGRNQAEIKSETVKIGIGLLAKKDPITGNVDADGAANAVAYMSDFLAEWDHKVKSGIPARELTDPKSPNYMGDRFKQYQKSPEQLINGMMNGAGRPPSLNRQYGFGETDVPSTAPPAPNKARLKGETPAQYLKRRGLVK